MIDVTIARENFDNLDVGLKIFFAILLATRKSNNEIDVAKSDIAQALNVSRQTVGKHIKAFSECNMLKYKYNGKGILNPKFYFVGDIEKMPDIQKYYDNFVSDV